MKLLVSGKPTRMIATTISNKWGCSAKTVERDITITYKEIKAYTQRKFDDVLGTHIARYERVYEQAMEMMDYANAIKALQATEKLLKMHEDTPLVAIQQNSLNLDGMSTTQIIEAIKVLKHGNQNQTN
jgi:hypothetical protein